MWVPVVKRIHIFNELTTRKKLNKASIAGNQNNGGIESQRHKKNKANKAIDNSNKNDQRIYVLVYNIEVDIRKKN